MESAKFKQCTADSCIFVRNDENGLTIVAVYVDDLIIMTSTPRAMKRLKDSLSARFQMKDLGKLRYCLGITVELIR